MNTKPLLYVIAITFLISCSSSNEDKIQSFADDIKELSVIEDLEVIQHNQSAIAISGANQGRVFTSTSKGLSGTSYGYINWKPIKNGTHPTHISQLCGESRMWFGPEFGKFSIAFDKGAEQIAENIKLSPELNTKKFRLIEKDELSRTFGNKMTIRNTDGYHFNIDVKRKISLLKPEDIESVLGITISNKISSVAFSAETEIKNTSEPWEIESGLLCIWELGCMLTTPKTKVLIPISKNTNSVTGYFTPITPERLQIKDNVVYYKADALGMNKIGIQPDLSKDIMGSYSPEKNLLNIVKFTFTNDSLYVNSLPKNKSPYSGDVTNIFNGEVNLPLDRNWPFYEFESSSSAKPLGTNETMNHSQTTFHFEGDLEDLNTISKKVLGVNLKEIPKF